MKTKINWRYCVKAAIFCIGTLSILFAFGDDNRPIVQWFMVHGSLFAIGIGAFYILSRLEKNVVAKF